MHVLVLVEVQTSLLTVEVVVVPAGILLQIKIEAGAESKPIPRVSVEHAAAEEIPVKGDLSAGSERQLVGEIAAGVVQSALQSVRFGEVPKVDQADPLLGHGFATVKIQILLAGLSGVGLGFRPGQATGVVLLGEVDHIKNEPKPHGSVEGIFKFAVEPGVSGGAVVAEAIEVEVAGAYQIVERTLLTACFKLRTEKGVGSRRKPGLHKRNRWAAFRLDPDDASRSATVERGGGPAQDLHACCRTQVETVDLPLTVRSRGGDAIDDEANAPDAEIGSRTKPTNGDTGVLGVVVGVEDKDPGDRLEGFVEGNLEICTLDRLGIDTGNGGGHLVERTFHSSG